MRLNPAEIPAALQQLKRADRVLAGVIDRAGPFTLKTRKSGYEVLVQAVISQQISTAAARTIRERLQALMPESNLLVWVQEILYAWKKGSVCTETTLMMPLLPLKPDWDGLPSSTNLL